MRAVTERRLFAVAILMFAFGVVVAAWTVERYGAAYDWVSHTTDVRLTIGRTISAASAHAPCEVASAELAEFARLTVDNPVQQARVPVLHGLHVTSCTTGSIDRLVRELGEADRVERGLTAERRQDLALARMMALIAAMLTLAIAVTCVALARARVRRAAAVVAESEERYRMLAANASDLVRILDPQGRTMYASPSARQILGFEPEEICRLGATALNHPDEAELMRETRVQVMQSRDVHTVTHRCRTKAGDYRWLETRVQPLHDRNGRLIRAYSHSRDITDRLEMERVLREIAVTDALTGLHNRRGFELVAAPALRLAARQQRAAAVVFIDLDGLKPINDQLGHEAGDRAIRELADVLRATLRNTDHLARLGGDELVAFAHDVDGDGARALVERIHRAIEARNRTDLGFTLAASVGVAVHDPKRGERSLEVLMGEADERMYEAKRARRQRLAS